MRIVMKEAPDVDFYVEYSTVSEGLTYWGNRERMLEHTSRHVDPYLSTEAPHHPETRMARCDETGTTSLWITTESLANPNFAAHDYPEDGSWEDLAGQIYQQQGMLSRPDLFVAAHRWQRDPSADISDLLTPFEHDTTEVGPDGTRQP